MNGRRFQENGDTNGAKKLKTNVMKLFIGGTLSLIASVVASGIILNIFYLPKHTDDIRSDEILDKSILEISLDKYKDDGLYKSNLMPYFLKNDPTITDKSFESYLEKRFKLRVGPTILDNDDKQPIYQRSVIIDGLELKSYSWRFSLNERLVFGFFYRDPNYKDLYNIKVSLVYTGLI